MKKTIPVSQIAMYVNPIPASFPDLPAGGATGKTFTITTNASDNDITVTTTNSSWITNLTKSRSGIAVDGSFTWTIGFNVTANMTTSARTGSIEVTIGETTKRVTVSQVSVPAAAPSNCYIVRPGAEIYIPVSRANEHNPSAIGANTPFTTELVWSDTPGLLAEQSTYGSGSTGAIRVKTAVGKRGNAVVAVKVDGVIKWSWHIWVTNYDPQTNLWDPHSAGGTTSQNIRFMDRDLGAMEASNTPAGWGLHYQWGRKDPFQPHNDWNIIAVNSTASVEESIQHPNTYYYKSQAHWLSQPDDNLWGGVAKVKTIYDPCPAGFRVPLGGAGTLSPWAGLEPSWGEEGGYTWGTSFWPYGSYRLSSAAMSFNVVSIPISAHWAATVNTVREIVDKYEDTYDALFHAQWEYYDPNKFDYGSNGFLVRCVVE
jgi:hypothetical protein